MVPYHIYLTEESPGGLDWTAISNSLSNVAWFKMWLVWDSNVVDGPVWLLEEVYFAQVVTSFRLQFWQELLGYRRPFLATQTESTVPKGYMSISVEDSTSDK